MVSLSVIPANPDAPWRDGPSTTELLITKPGETSAVTLATGGVAASWSVNPPTSLSAEVLTADLVRAFQTTDVRAYWLTWKHSTLGTWAGEINDCEDDLQTGTTELAANDFSALLNARRVAKVYDVAAAPAGALAKRIIIDAQREAGSYAWIRTINAEETGDPIPFQVRGGKVSDALRSLVSKSGDEWYVDSSRVLWWQKKRGQNRTATVTLVQGRHIVGGRRGASLGPVVNDLLVVPANQNYARSQAFVIDDDASIIRFGRRQDQLIYTVGATEATLRPAAKKDLARLKAMGDSVTFNVTNVDNVFGSFGDGDSIYLLLPSINKRLQVRVMARSYDTESGVLSVSGDVES